MGGYRRDPATIGDRDMPDQDRIGRHGQDEFEEEDRRAQALRRVLERDGDMDVPQLGDVARGLVGSNELTHGLHLPIGVSLDHEELGSSQARAGTETYGRHRSFHQY